MNSIIGTAGYNLLINKNLHFLSNLFFITNKLDSLCRDLKGKIEEYLMHPNSIHYNRYINFIYSRQFRKIPEEIYIEKHHIIPKSLNGTNDNGNLIQLTAREHFIAHLILWKAFKGPMTQAFRWMSDSNRFNNKLTSKQYERLKNDREKVSEETKNKMSNSHGDVSGKNNPFYGKHCSKEHKQKQSKSLINTTFVYKNGKTIRIKIENLNDYIKMGYCYGMIQRRPDKKIWIHKGDLHKMVYLEDYENIYLGKDFEKGRKFSKNHRNNVIKGNKNRIISKGRK